MKKLSDYSRVILASQSPRRLDILRAHGIEPIVMPADVDETLQDGVRMEDAVIYLSRIKAEACLRSLGTNDDDRRAALGDDTLIIAADTVVYTDTLGIMGKPADYDEAFLMLSTIRNTSHYVATGVTLIDADDILSFCDVTTVWCRDYTDDEIDDYIRVDQPYDKAGSYAIQSAFGQHIDHIDGGYENVVGLPYPRIESELACF